MIYLTASKHPHIVIQIKIGDIWKEVDCLIDTGYSAGIALPETFLQYMTSQSKWKQTFELADGSEVNFDLYKMHVRYRDKIRILSAIFSKGNDALVGIEFLDGFKFVLDLKKYAVSLT